MMAHLALVVIIIAVGHAMVEFALTGLTLEASRARRTRGPTRDVRLDWNGRSLEVVLGDAAERDMSRSFWPPLEERLKQANVDVDEIVEELEAEQETSESGTGDGRFVRCPGCSTSKMLVPSQTRLEFASGSVN